ncbi:MAG: dihydrofolate reductase family protein [Thaumarchaeota archaeon]|nr:dihydrofolate reductase family protein [Nitrososphaerota archaeon]
MQAPSGPEEDTSGGFKHGGWAVPYYDWGKVFDEQTGHRFDLLLGRKTYEVFSAYWPLQGKKNNFAREANRGHKYVASRTLKGPLTWKNSVLLKGDVAAEVRMLKNQDGPEIQVYGSSNLIQTLLKNDLVDELWLKIYPITLGYGQRLFAEGTIPAAFKLRDSMATPKGVIIADYVRAGEVRTSSFG